MFHSLPNLLTLQDRDLNLTRTQSALAHLPAEKAQLENDLQAASAHLMELKNKGQKLDQKRKTLDAEVKAKQELLGKYRTRQVETRKNDEYQALANEIMRTEKAIQELEDQELELMEEYEQLQKEVLAESEKVQAQTQKTREMLEGLESKAASLNEKINQLQKEITQMESSIDPAILQQYRRIFKNKKSAAVVELIHGTTCGGCHMKLTHQTVISVKTSDKPVFCEQCGRILYISE